MPVRTKIEMNPAMARRISGLDDLARIFFPDNRNHQRAFIVIWLEIKYADKQFLPSSTDIASRYDISSRILDIVRSKLKKLGIIKRISHFNPTHGYRSGWMFSSGCSCMLQKLARMIKSYETATHDSIMEEKDRASLHYI